MKGVLLRILGVLAVLALLLPAGCGEDEGVLQPAIPPGSNGGTTIAGVAQIQGEPPGAGVVVTLERVEGGASGTVRALATQNARELAEGKSQTPALDHFGRDLTKMAREDKLDPIIGRDDEIQRVAQILSRRKKNNPRLN